MASRPFYDKTKKRWFMKWWAGSERGWIKQPLGPQPNDLPVKKTPPKSIQLVARRYEDLETQARHGVIVAKARTHGLAEYVEGYKTIFEATRKNASPDTLRYALATFLPFCEKRGVRSIEAVSRVLCRDWLESLTGKLQYSTIKTYKGYLSPIWSRAVDDEIVPKNPWHRLPIPGRPNDSEPVYWTRGELDKLMKTTDGWLHDLIVLGVNTGLRITALLGIEWRDLDFDRGHLVVRKELSKSSRKYYVPLNTSANQVLLRRAALKRPGELLVMAGEKSGGTVKRTDTYRRLKRAAELAGVPDKGHHNHILRHTFASHAAMRGIPLAIISGWMGHRSLRQIDIYAHLIPGESNSRMESFDLAPPRIDETEPSPANPNRPPTA